MRVCVVHRADGAEVVRRRSTRRADDDHEPQDRTSRRRRGAGLSDLPELKPYLEAAWDALPPNTEWLVWQYRGRGINLRTQFERIIKRAGLVPWERLFQNLRASRETELMAKFPAKDVAAWIGHSVPVAMKHYAMATDDNFLRASSEPSVKSGSICGSKNGSITSGSTPSLVRQRNEKTPNPCESWVLMAVDGSVGCHQWAMRGSNPDIHFVRVAL